MAVIYKLFETDAAATPPTVDRVPAEDAVDQILPTTTKGDLVVYSTTNIRLPVGTDEQVIVADSSQPSGVKWTTQTNINKLSTVAGINGKVAGFTNLYTVPAGKKAIVTRAIIRLITVSGTGTNPKISIGSNAGADNMFNDTNLTGLDTVLTAYLFSAQAVLNLGNAGEIVKLEVVSASNKTTYTFDVDLFGYTF